MDKPVEQKIRYSIVIPAYNEEEGLALMLESLQNLDKSIGEIEIVVVNDGSSDKTSEIACRYPVSLFEHRGNKGYGAAIKTGIKAASGDIVVICDSDGQHRWEDVQQVLFEASKYDMVIGKRTKGSHIQKNRILGKTILQLVAAYLTWQRIPDLNSGLRSFKREIILKYLHLLPDSFSASTTSTIIFMKRAYDIEWIPIKTNQRKGKSSVRQVKHGFHTLLLILRIIILFHPLKVFMPLSVIFGFAGFIWGILFLSNSGLSIFAAMLILSGLIIFMFGLVCDQISSLRLEKLE